MTGFRA